MGIRRAVMVGGIQRIVKGEGQTDKKKWTSKGDGGNLKFENSGFIIKQTTDAYHPWTMTHKGQIIGRAASLKEAMDFCDGIIDRLGPDISN